MKKSINKCLHSLKSHYTAKNIDFKGHSIFKFLSGVAMGIGASTPIANWPSLSIYIGSPAVAAILTVADQDIVSDYNKNLETIANEKSNQTNNLQRSNLDVTATNIITSSAEYGLGIAVGYNGANVLGKLMYDYL
jgi:hypothetical protein